MNMPGFFGEYSLSKTARSYTARATVARSDSGAAIVPQVSCSTCFDNFDTQAQVCDTMIRPLRDICLMNARRERKSCSATCVDVTCPPRPGCKAIGIDDIFNECKYDCSGGFFDQPDPTALCVQLCELKKTCIADPDLGMLCFPPNCREACGAQ
jgi:hypothetical protein